MIETRTTGLAAEIVSIVGESAVTACSLCKINRDVVALRQFALDASGLTLY